MYTVMIVDDDIPVLEFLKTTIKWETLGYQLTGVYASPLDALKAGQQTKTDVLISDIGMPGINGLELIKSLREEDRT